MKPKDADAFCDEWLKAWTENAPEKLIAFYHNEAFYSDPTVKKGIRGHGELLPYFTTLLRNNPAWVWTREEIFPNDAGFVLKWKAVIPVRDVKIIEYGMDIVEIRDGRITRNEVYFDTRPLIDAILKKQEKITSRGTAR